MIQSNNRILNSKENGQFPTIFNNTDEFYKLSGKRNHTQKSTYISKTHIFLKQAKPINASAERVTIEVVLKN